MSKIRGYKIIKTLGRGGMATVYLAVQKSVDRYVALKVMAPELIAEKTFTARFLSEARIAARFRHPNIIAILDVNVEKGLPYIAMEYVPGGSLTQERIEKMSLLQKLSVLAQVADALGFLHRKNFIHRDVKPDNVIFREDDTAVLTDFGIARDESSDLSMTKTGSVIGTPYYMSPEQARGKKLDARSDLYSLGVMLYKVLTGKVPFEADDALSIYIMHVKETVPDLPEEFAALDPVVKRLMAKAPEDRYPDANALIQDLAKVANTTASQLLNRSFEGVALEITGETDAEYDDNDQEASPEVSAQTAVLKTSDPGLGPGGAVAAQSSEPGAVADGKIAALKQRGVLLWAKARIKLDPAVARLRQWLAPISSRISKERRLALGLVAAVLVLLVVVMVPGSENTESLDSMLARALAIANSDDPEQRQEAEGLFNRVLELDPTRAAAAEGLKTMAALKQRKTPTEIETPEDPRLPARSRTEQAVQRLLSAGARALNEGRLTKPGQDNAYAKFRAALELAPANGQAQQGLQAVADQLAEQIGAALDAGDRDLTAILLADARRIGQDGTQAYRDLSSRFDQLAPVEIPATATIEALLARGVAHLAADRLMKPDPDNAVSVFRTVLQIEANNLQARAGLDRVAQRYLELAGQAIDGSDRGLAKTYLDRAIDISPLLPGLTDLAQRLAQLPEQPPEPVKQTEQPPNPVTTVDTPIKTAALPKLSLTGNESASSLFQQAEANLKTNQQLLAYALYQAVLVRDPGHRQARRRLHLGAQQYIRLASRDIGNGKMESAKKNLHLATAIDPAHPELDAVQRAYRTGLESRTTADTTEKQADGLASMRLKLLLSSAETARSRYASDPSNHQAANAATRNYQDALATAPGNQQATAGLNALGQSLLKAGLAAVSKQQFDEANWCLELAQAAIPDNPGIDLLAAAINSEAINNE